MQVFISHDFKDSKLAQRVADVLKDNGFDVWDESQILPGDNWAKTIGNELENSDAMVVLLTPNSVKSPNILNEIGYALGNKEYKGRLIPVIAADSEHPQPFEVPWILKKFPIIHIPSSEEEEEGLKQIIQTLKKEALINFNC
jgi:hypothetical protein